MYRTTDYGSLLFMLCTCMLTVKCCDLGSITNMHLAGELKAVNL